MTEHTAKLVKFPSSLIGPDDPPAVEVINPQAPGAVVFICDHASNAVPKAMAGLGVDDSVLRRHVAWDIGAADVARRLADRFDATLVLSGYSRLVIDCNRELDDPTSIPVISDGVVIPGNRDLSEAQAAARAGALFHPYHHAIDEAVGRIRRRGDAPAILSIHSFTPIFKGFERPWHIGVLWDRDPRIARPLMEALSADPTITVGDNQPYSARDHYGHSINTHAEAAGLPHVLIEVRQDLIDTHHGAEAWASRLGAALAGILENNPDLYRVETH